MHQTCVIDVAGRTSSRATYANDRPPDRRQRCRGVSVMRAQSHSSRTGTIWRAFYKGRACGRQAVKKPVSVAVELASQAPL